MTTEYSFTSQDGVHIGQHHENPEKDVLINSKWVTPPESSDDDEVSLEAPWEEVIGALISENLTEYVDVTTQDRVGSMPLDRAMDNLVEGIDEIEDGDHARALIECMQDEGIVDADGDQVVMFKNPVDADTKHTYIYNWAAAVSVTTEKIVSQLERAEQLDEQLQKRMEKVTDYGKSDLVSSETRDPQELIDEIDREMRALGDPDSNRVPDPGTLSPKEEKQFRDLHQSLQIARSRKRLQTGAGEEAITAGEVDVEEAMEGEIENFEQLLIAFSEYEQDLREIIAKRAWDRDGIGDLLENLTGMISDIARLDQSLEEQDHEEVDQMLREMSTNHEDHEEAVEEMEAVDREDRDEAVESNQTLSRDLSADSE